MRQRKKSTVVFDLKTYSEQAEDFLDGLEAFERLNEPEEDYKTAMDRIIFSKGNKQCSDKS